MKQKMAAAIMLLLAVLGLSLTAMAAQTPPVISVVGTVVEDAGVVDNTYFELAMKIEPGDEGFFAAGITLQYDTSKLILVDWNGNAIDLTQSTSWSTAMPVPAIGPKGLSGKWAYAYQETITAEDADKQIGYLSLIAEAPKSMSLTEDMQKVVNVRFKYADDAAREEIVNDLNTLTEFSAEKIIGFAPDDVAAESVVNQSVWYQANDENTIYYYTTVSDPANSAGAHYGTLLAKPEFVLTKGETVNSGSSGMTLDQVGVIMFYDWQESFMGAAPISKTSTQESLMSELDNFARANYDETVKPYTTDMTTHESRYVDNKDKVLTFKKGYNFAGWVPVTVQTLESTFTAYADETEASGAVVSAANPITASSGVVYLKAAYVANEELNKVDEGTSSGLAAYYTYSNYGFGRFDANTYYMEFYVERRNADNYGVTRLQSPVAKISMTINGATIYLKENLTGEDSQRVRIYVPKATVDTTTLTADDSFTLLIVDNADGNYIGARPSSSNNTFYPLKQGTVSDSGWGYMAEGMAIYTNSIVADATASYLNDEAHSEWQLRFAAAQFREAGLLDEAQNQDYPTTSDGVFVNVAKNKIMLYKAAKGGRDLSYTELQEAIAMRTGLNIKNVCSKDILKPQLEKINAKVAISGEMTANELETFINNGFN